MVWSSSSCVEWRELTLKLTGKKAGDLHDNLALDLRTHLSSSEFYTRHCLPRRELTEPNLAPVQSVRWWDAKLMQKRH